MDDLSIILKGIIKIIKNFFPAVAFLTVGLPVLAYIEKVDKQPKKKRPYRRPPKKVQ